MTCTDTPSCVVGNRLITLNELFGLIIDYYPKKINHKIRWEDHQGLELSICGPMLVTDIGDSLR